jgi:hypothetical protein
VGLADFYNEELMPHITYFDSDEHLQHLINHTAYLDISGKMQCQSKVRKNNIYCQWSNIISSLC